ncbi:MAG: hypothetical protein ABJ004_07830 [Cyclobacteriaceae bacterium]
MEFGTTILGLVAIALCIIPFVVMHKSRKKREQDLIDGLKAVADSYSSDVTTYDCGMEFSIGISWARNYIFYYKKTDQEVFELCVPLTAIRKCQVNNVKRSIKTQAGSQTVIDKLELTFLPKDTSISPSRFEFFNSNEHFQMNGELLLIRKWEGIVNKALRENHMVAVSA